MGLVMRKVKFWFWNNVTGNIRELHDWQERAMSACLEGMYENTAPLMEACTP